MGWFLYSNIVKTRSLFFIVTQYIMMTLHLCKLDERIYIIFISDCNIFSEFRINLEISESDLIKRLHIFKVS